MSSTQDRPACVARRRFSRDGVSSVEVLVVIGILSLLAALLLPALQESRELARQAVCRNRIRQLALACANFESLHGRLPGGCGSPHFTRPGQLPGPFSAHAELLPHLGLAVIFERIDWADNALQAYPVPGGGPNGDVSLLQLPILKCPGDPARTTGTNYRFCTGAGHIRNLKGSMSCLCGNGRIDSPSYSRLVDGLSNTALSAERLRGDMNDAVLSLQCDILTPGGVIWLRSAFLSRDPDRILRACDRVNRTGVSEHMSHLGATWLFSGNAYTWYNHILPPNARIPDCSQSGRYLGSAAVSARSFHPGLVNVAMADGSVRAVSDNVALDIWRSIARIDDGR